MAVGNTFGATVLSSYGGFWISVGIIYTPGGFNVMATLEEADGGGLGMFYDSFALMLFVSYNRTLFFFFFFGPWSEPTNSLELNLGLVHLHHPHALLHPEIHRRLLLSLPGRRHLHSPLGDWIPPPWPERRAEPESDPGWWVLCHPDGLSVVV